MTNEYDALAAQLDGQEPRFWEPWHPEIGQRVRVNPSPECKMDWATSVANLGGHPTVKGHPAWFRGLLGTVDMIGNAWPEWASHPYAVRFDTPTPCVCGRDMAYGGWFAAIELESIRSQSDKEEGEDLEPLEPQP